VFDALRYACCVQFVPLRTNTYAAPALTLPTDALAAASPTASPPAGTYQGPIAVTLTSATADAVIYYTLDGSAPTRASTRYTGKFQLASSATVRAIAFTELMERARRRLVNRWRASRSRDA
jgi:hypothetical protein